MHVSHVRQCSLGYNSRDGLLNRIGPLIGVLNRMPLHDEHGPMWSGMLCHDLSHFEFTCLGEKLSFGAEVQVRQGASGIPTVLGLCHKR